MAISNSDRIKTTLELLREGLKPFVERRIKAVWGAQWPKRLRQAEDHLQGQGNEPIQWDSHLLLRMLCYRWDEFFSTELGRDSRNTAHVLLDVRNKYAHERAFTSPEALQALGHARDLLKAVAARTEWLRVENLHDELMRTIVAEKNRVRRKADPNINTGKEVAGTPWRDIVHPHADVLSDAFTDAEFAADLGQVSRGEARAEYGDPREFFKRTFLTAGLEALLTSAARRFVGKGGDPVIELQTGFGGGKTHSMLALYHMSGAGSAAKNLQGVDDLLRKLGLTDLPAVKRAVFVGTMRGVSDIDTQADGTSVRTIWGSLAWQLAGRPGFDLVAAADREGTAPGSNALVQLLRLAQPCLILIDEWVAFIRQLYRFESPSSAGTFEANLTFVQSLSEAARAVPGAAVVASLPVSEVEIGGDGGKAALKHLEATFGRMESPWRAATADESFEIVRRRLFEPVLDAQKLRDRDRTIEAFWRMYCAAKQEFPLICSEVEYRERMRKAYPIHPALFDQLYQSWGSLDRFQRTRGVLRMVASIVQVNWENAYDHRMILPSQVPLDDSAMQAEIFKSLDKDWTAVLDKDIEGVGSVARKIDSEINNLGRYAATRRVARCLFMGTVPTVETSEHPGISDREVRLGCAQPGEVHQSYGDALRRLSGHATYLYQEGSVAWFATKPSVIKLAADRAQTFRDEDIVARIVQHLRQLTGRGKFDRAHVAPGDSSDVLDIDSARLVVLGPHSPFVRDRNRSAAHRDGSDILLHRGKAQRRFRNSLIFLAADEENMRSVQEAVSFSLAWESIVNDSENDRLDLDNQQYATARRRQSTASDMAQARIAEAWHRVMRPEKVESDDTVSWQSFHLGGTGTLAERVSERLQQDEQLIDELGPRRLNMLLDEYGLWRDQPHISTQRVWEDLCSFLHLPRLRNRGVLIGAIKGAVTLLHNDLFAFARSLDKSGTNMIYRSLAIEGQSDLGITLDDKSLLVTLDAARAQCQCECTCDCGCDFNDCKCDGQCECQCGCGKDVCACGCICDCGCDQNGCKCDGQCECQCGCGVKPVYRRFFGSVPMNPERLIKDGGCIEEQVLSHLTSKPGVEVKVSLEIAVNLPDGIEEVEAEEIRQNCQNLNFQTFNFERE